MNGIDPKLLDDIQSRMRAIQDWLSDAAPYAAADQKHLDENTPERAYWHYGYLAALTDVLKKAGIETTPARDNGGKSS
jgi:hypothetical protein